MLELCGRYRGFMVKNGACVLKNVFNLYLVRRLCIANTCVGWLDCGFKCLCYVYRYLILIKYLYLLFLWIYIPKRYQFVLKLLVYFIQWSHLWLFCIYRHHKIVDIISTFKLFLTKPFAIKPEIKLRLN